MPPRETACRGQLAPAYRGAAREVDLRPFNNLNGNKSSRVANPGVSGSVLFAWRSVHGAAQPASLVNDLKLGDLSGAVALWIGPRTEGYFIGLSISPASGETK